MFRVISSRLSNISLGSSAPDLAQEQSDVATGENSAEYDKLTAGGASTRGGREGPTPRDVEAETRDPSSLLGTLAPKLPTVINVNIFYGKGTVNNTQAAGKKEKDGRI